jgi:hypothetical protein
MMDRTKKHPKAGRNLGYKAFAPPPGVNLPDSGLPPEVVARLVRMTGGNLRLLTRLLTQLERVLGVNDTQSITVEIVDAARDSLVIGQA